METFRCPTCFFMLSDPGLSRCPSCHKKLRRRDRPIVLGDKKHFGTHAGAIDIDLVLAARAERAQATFTKDPLVTSVPAPAVTQHEDVSTATEPLVVSEADRVQHTTIFEPSQFDPEMRQVLDSLYRKARSEPDFDDKS